MATPQTGIKSLFINITIPVNAPRSLTINLTVNVPDLPEEDLVSSEQLQEPVPATSSGESGGPMVVQDRTVTAVGIPVSSDESLTEESESDTQEDKRPIGHPPHPLCFEFNDPLSMPSFPTKTVSLDEGQVQGHKRKTTASTSADDLNPKRKRTLL